MRVAYQGVELSYSYLAARQHVGGDGAAYDGHRDFRDAVDALADGRADLAVLPIENTTAGSITEVYDLLRETGAAIVGEETWRVDHCLAGPADVPLDRLARVHSHPQGLAQCSRFLRTLPGCELVAADDTAGALRLVAGLGDPAQAAIGPPEAAAALGLAVLRRGIANQAENWTRFVVLAREPVPVPAGTPAKTSVVLVTRHEPGALLRCLAPLAEHDVSLGKLESRPRPGRPWEYVFFVDVEGALTDPDVAAALAGVRARALDLTILGSYPARAMPGAAAPS